ncbi:hypothetical protein TOPH_03424, partial [Tolypocladium ophioglossoides CBS 100239]
MPTITDLPCEVVASILRNLDSLQSLLRSLLVCRHFYSSMKESSGVEATIVQQQITPALLPYSVAVMEASRLPYPRIEDSVRNLLDTLFHEPAQLTSRVRTMPRRLIGIMARTHDVVHRLATDFATDSWARLSQADASSASKSLSLSPAEYFRFCRALYQVELFYSLFRGEPGDSTGTFEESMNPWFFSRQPPWENEQLGCVQEFLEAKLAEASLDVVAHEVEFGEFSIDYLTVGGDNHWRQLWLAQGIGFTYQLMNASSYDVKQALLTSGSDGGRANLPEALAGVFEADPEDVILEDYSEEEIQSLVLLGDDTDTDMGPYESWRAAHYDLPRADWLMLSDDAWLRERAYVLWDLERIQTHHLLELFGGSPQSPGPVYHDEDLEEMQESFDERSNIWQRGGSGYWSKGDYSMIVWPSQSEEKSA